jgi:spore coat protein A
MLPWQRATYAAFAQSPALLKFGENNPLRLFGVGIPAAAPNTALYPGVDYYQIVMQDYFDTLHPDLPPTHLYGYADAAAPDGPVFKHLGGAIIAKKDRPVRISWQNRLPQQHILPADTTVIDPYMVGVAGGLYNRAAPHLHGGLVPWLSDGGPFHWFDPDGNVGASVTPWLLDSAGNPTYDYWYPNRQSARMMWYHDHAVGITRLNAYAGLATGYLLKDDAETILMNQLGILPERQIPMVIQDKVFSHDGSLWYPDTYDTQFFALTPGGQPLQYPSLVPEFWGDTMLVNGTAYPTLTVYPRRYRFQILNACNTRVVNLQLFRSLGKKFPDSTEPNLRDPGPDMVQIGTEGGFLDGTVVPQGVVVASKDGGAGILLAPAERCDIVVDFSMVKPGTFIILHNDAPVPYPGGTPLADFHPENNKLPVPPLPGYGPNTRTLMQFYVADPAAAPGPVPADGAIDPAWTLPPSPPPVAGTVTRELALYETIDAYGRLTQNLGDLTAPLSYIDPATENVQAGSVETWRIYNLSADTHPIHFHYFNVRIVSRQPINNSFALTGNPIPPDPNEQGWKETVRMNPGECITMLAEFPPLSEVTPPAEIMPAEGIPQSPRTGGHEYVWHCHILEHEEHDMMRPLILT